MVVLINVEVVFVGNGILMKRLALGKLLLQEVNNNKVQKGV